VAKDVSSALEGELLVVPTDREVPLVGYSERTVDPNHANSSDKSNSIDNPVSNSNASSIVIPKTK